MVRGRSGEVWPERRGEAGGEGDVGAMVVSFFFGPGMVVVSFGWGVVLLC